MGRRKKRTIYSLGTIIIPISFLIGGLFHSIGVHWDQNSFPFFTLLSILTLFILVMYSTWILKPKKTVFYVELVGNITLLFAAVSFIIPWLQRLQLLSYFGFVLAGIYLLLKYLIYDRVHNYLFT